MMIRDFTKKNGSDKSEPFKCYEVSALAQTKAPQQFLYFLPLPQVQGSLRPTFGPARGAAG